MNMRKYLTELQQKGRLYFTLKDAIRVFKKPKENLLSRINYYVKKGEIVSPLRGLYIIIPIKDRRRGSLQPQDMVVITMRHLGIPYYAALSTAATYHGASHQAPQVFQVITNKRIRRPWIIGRVSIEFIYKKDMQKTETEQRVVSTGYLNISTPEQTAKDIMIYYEKSGGLNHQATILSELIEAVNIKKLLEIANKDNKRTWIQRMGYILSKIDPLDTKKRDKVAESLYKFLKQRKHNFIALAPELTTLGSQRDKKWKIIENTTVQADI